MWVNIRNANQSQKHKTCPSELRRYHYNVSPDRLDVHVKKGWQDRLSITSVGSCQGLWALIMDSNPGFMSQVPPYSAQRASGCRPR